MTIESIDVNEDALQKIGVSLRGLEPLRMAKLERFILLTGQNGAGKSRILRLINEVIRQVPLSGEVCQREIDELQNRHQEISDNSPFSGGPHPQKDREESDALDIKIENRKLGVNFHNNALWKYSVESVSSFYIDLNNIHLPPSTDMTHGQWQQAPQCLSAWQDSLVPSLIIPYLYHIFSTEFRMSHPRSPASLEQKKTAQKEAHSLNELAQRFLKGEFSLSPEDDVLLFSRPLQDADLSPGQKVILHLIVLLHVRKSSPDGLILLLDEPENHLHPSALIDLFEHLADTFPKAQFWIATHSIPLLSHFYSKEPNSLWYIEHGTASQAGRAPERILLSLLGEEQRREQLHHFLGEPDQLAIANFAAECLLPPTVSDRGRNDPQVLQIAQQLKEYRDSIATPSLHVLDYGAGQGRVLGGLHNSDQAKTQGIVNNVTYYACDLEAPPEVRQHCKGVIDRYAPNTSAQRYFALEDWYDAAGKIQVPLEQKQTMDVVILSNVLHEIPPQDWGAVFAIICDMLKPEGFLLLIEDCIIPRGELPHALGFFVLRTEQLCVLFDTKEQDLTVSYAKPEKYDERLQGHLIPRRLVNQYHEARLRPTLECLQSTARSAIAALRKEREQQAHTPVSLLQKSKHAFWTQQLANCVLYLSPEDVDAQD